MRFLALIIFFLISLIGLSQNDSFFKVEPIENFEEVCIRSIPEPILSKADFSDYRFEIINGFVFEYASLLNNEQVIIKNCGCESYVLIFRFIIPRNNTGMEDINRWYKEIPKRLAILQDKSSAPIDLNKAILTLVNYIDNYDNHPLLLNKEIIVEEGEIPTKMSFERVQELDNHKVALELSIWVGPL